MYVIVTYKMKEGKMFNFSANTEQLAILYENKHSSYWLRKQLLEQKRKMKVGKNCYVLNWQITYNSLFWRQIE